MPGGVEGLCCGRGEVGDPEVAQESENQRHSERTKDGPMSHTATSLRMSCLVTADLWSGWGSAEQEIALRVRFQAGEERSLMTSATRHS